LQQTEKLKMNGSISDLSALKETCNKSSSRSVHSALVGVYPQKKALGARLLAFSPSHMA